MYQSSLRAIYGLFYISYEEYCSQGRALYSPPAVVDQNWAVLRLENVLLRKRLQLVVEL
jgi:hypothetical protein